MIAHLAATQQADPSHVSFCVRHSNDNMRKQGACARTVAGRGGRVFPSRAVKNNFAQAKKHRPNLIAERAMRSGTVWDSGGGLGIRNRRRPKIPSKIRTLESYTPKSRALGPNPEPPKPSPPDRRTLQGQLSYPYSILYRNPH